MKHKIQIKKINTMEAPWKTLMGDITEEVQNFLDNSRVKPLHVDEFDWSKPCVNKVQCNPMQ